MSTQTDFSRPRDVERSSAADAATGAQDKATEAAGQAQEKAQQAAGEAQAKAREQLNQRSTQLAEQVQHQASDLRSVSGALRDQGKDRPAQVIDRLAEYAEHAGRYLRDKDADAMLADAEDFGRRKPAAVGAGGLALGFVASRFLKASSRKRYSARDAQPPLTPPTQASTTARVAPPTAIEPTSAGTTGTPARSGI